ncbi:2-oxo acid dehydrogenase subunit E2 [Xanthobacter autotrophicus DSM 431]|uniref:2-oxo acid dehydrogenase subunit E2 n=1 Tax=Xanthobacter nonsaccharivorans TaxID=3119912 RepID=UPI003728F5DC
MPVDIRVPSLGESVAEATIARWLRQPGDAVRRDEVIAELETEKVTIEVAAPADGEIAVLHAAQGESVRPGALLATLRATRAGDVQRIPSAASACVADAAAAPGLAVMKLVAQAPAPPPHRPAHKAEPEPAPRGGPETLVTIASLRSTAATPRPAPPAVPASRTEDAGGGARRVPFGALRSARAQRLKDAQTVAAMITTFNDVDLSQVDTLIAAHGAAFRARRGVELDRMAFIVRGCIHALAEVPQLNGRIDGDEILHNLDMHIAVPIETAAGLVSPVLRRAGELDLGDIAVALTTLRARAEAGTLSVAELQGGTFSIADAGPFGGLLSVPILAAPQSGVLGVHRVEDRPVAVAGAVAVRPMMYVSLSYDHRLIDGRESVTFLVRLKEFLQSPELMLL